MRLVRQLAVAGAFALLASSSAYAATLDDFNRPDSSDLGPNWTQVDGSSGIVSDQAYGSDNSLATFNGGTGNTVSFDISNPEGTSYVGAVLNYQDEDNNYFIKVQSNGGSAFDYYAFYYGNNGSGLSSDSLFSALSSPFTGGHVTASVVGQHASLTIDPTGGAEQVYTFDYTTPLSGTGVGLGFYGNARADNFGASLAAAAVPEPATWAMMIVGFLGMGALLRRKRTAVATA